MDKEKEKKASETEEEKKSDIPPEEKPQEDPKEDKPVEKASDDKQADENGEGAEVPPEEKLEEKSNDVPDIPETSETDKLKAENLTLKTQLEALKIGFKPDCLEDAVVLAENIVKRDSTDITAALQSVAKKYPDWKSDAKSAESAGGFKVGADSSKGDNKQDDSKLSQAFGIRKKK